MSGDHRTYTLRLDPRATSSDGRPALANDVLFTLNKILDAPSMQFSSWFESMDRGRTVAIGSRTVRVVFKTARAAQLLAFNIGVMPEHVYRGGDFSTNAAVVGNCIAWNLRRPPFDDPRVRRALAMAFDRRAVIDALYHGQARAVTGPFTPDQWANDPTVEAIEFNPQAARAALEAIGWRDTDRDGILDRGGHPLAFTLLIPPGNVARDQAAILQAALRDIGVSMEVSAMESASFFDRVLHGNFEAAFFSWVNEPDPDPFSLFHSSQKAPAGLNVGGYASADADRLLEQACVELDAARRATLYHQLHALLARDQPYLWMVQVSSKSGPSTAAFRTYALPTVSACSTITPVRSRGASSDRVQVWNAMP